MRFLSLFMLFLSTVVVADDSVIPVDDATIAAINKQQPRNQAHYHSSPDKHKSTASLWKNRNVDSSKSFDNFINQQSLYSNNKMQSRKELL